MNQINPITIGGDWVASVKESIPDHSKDIKLNLDAVINRSGLDPIDAHACALAAAANQRLSPNKWRRRHHSRQFHGNSLCSSVSTSATLP